MVTGPPQVRLWGATPIRPSVPNAISTPSERSPVVGWLCVMDEHPHTLSAADRGTIRTLAAVAADEWGHCAMQETDHAERLRLLSAAMNELNEAVVITNHQIDAPGPTIEYVNRAFTEMTGYTPDEVIGQSPRLLQGPNTDRRVLDRVREHLKTGTAVQAKTVNYRKDGTPYRLQWSMSPVRDPDGTIQHWVSVQRDVTRAYQQQQELQNARELLDRVIETANVGICVTNSDREFVLVNSAYTELYGWDRDDLIGEPFTKVLPPADRERGAEAHDRFLFDRADESTGEWIVECKDGSRKNVLVTAGYLEQNGEPFKVTTVLDITDRKRSEQKLKEAKEEAESASRLKSALLANMSHEIRTPLTSIIGFSEVLDNELDGSHGVFAERVHNSSKRLMETLESVLELSRLDAGLHTPEVAPVNLPKELREIVEMLQPKADSADVDLLLTVEESLSMVSDRTAVSRIVMNLVGNAIKFTDAGGQVTVRACRADETVCIEVDDTGIGIDPEFRDALFDAFTQESQGLKRSYEGSGLGLALVDRLVNALHGSIAVEGEKGEGTCFRVELPRDLPNA